MREREWIRDRGSNTLFIAFWRTKNRLVAVRRVKLADGVGWSDSDSKWATECQSAFCVRVYDVVRRENEVWVSCRFTT